MTNYEWDIEVTDREDGDILDHVHGDALSQFNAECITPASYARYGLEPALHLVLVRDSTTRTGLIDRHWVYVREDGTLPDHFEDAMGNTGPAVPARFRAELAKWLGGAK